METETPTSRAAPAEGSALPAWAAEQRGALTRYAAQLLEGEASHAAEIVDLAMKEMGVAKEAAAGARADATAAAAEPGENGENQDGDAQERAVQKGFAAVRRHSLARLRQEGIAQRTAAADGDEAGATLEQRVERLTPKQREAVWLKFSHGFRYEAIARITGLSIRNVGFLLHSALTNLREAVAPEGKVAAADDSRPTDFVLGEMSEPEREAFEGAMRQDAVVKAAMSEVRALTGNLRAALGGDAGAQRAPKKKRRTGAGFWRTKWFYATLAGVLVAVAVVVWLKRKPSESAARVASDGEEFRMKPDAWKLAKARAERDGVESRAGVAGGGAGSPVKAAGRKPVAEPEKPKAKAADDDQRTPVIQGEGRGEGSEGKPASGVAAAAGGGEGKPVNDADAPAGTLGDGKAGTEPTSTETGNGRAASDAGESSPEGGKKDTFMPAGPAGRSRGLANPKAASAAKNSAQAAQPETEATTKGRDAKSAKGATMVDKASKQPGEVRREIVGGPAARDATEAKRAQVREREAVGIPALLEEFSVESEVPVAPVVASKEQAQEEGLTVAAEVAEAPWAPERRLVRVHVLAKPAKTAREAAANVVLLIDVSGSMDAPNRLPLVQEAARRLLGDLRPEDRVGIVTYAGDARVALPPTPVARAGTIRATLAALRPEGMTNGGAGLRRAYEVAHEGFVTGGVNRVVLCTDGDFNMGMTSENELAALVEKEAKGGVGLAVFGFGRGRQIDPRLESLAAKGRGGSGNVTTRRDAERKMDAEVNGWRAMVAREVRVDFDCDPARVAVCRLVGYEDSFIPPETAERRRVEVAEMAPGESVTALFEIVPMPGAGAKSRVAEKPADWVTVRVGYTAADGRARALSVPVVDKGGRFDEASAGFRFSAAVAGLGLALRESPPSGERIAEVVTWTEAAAGELTARDAGGAAEEFLALAREARELAKEVTDANRDGTDQGFEQKETKVTKSGR